MISNNLLRFRTRRAIVLTLLVLVFLLISAGMVWAATHTVSDDFSSGGYSGGSASNPAQMDWVGDWIASDDTDPATLPVWILNEEVAVRVDSNIYRTVDLSNATNATISLDYEQNGQLEPADRAIIEICSDTSFGTCQMLVDVSDDFGSGSISNEPINADVRTATTTLRARVIDYGRTYGPYERFLMDNVVISAEIPDATDDWGDAPDSYGTTSGASGPSHTVVSGLEMGSAPDAESDGVPGVNADGDDNAGSDDEDGVSSFATLTDQMAGQTYNVTVAVTNTIGSTANLIGWIDFDINGTFDSNEAATTTVADGTTNGSAELAFTVPSDVQDGTSYARFRLTTDSITNSEPGGSKTDGEVEDYPITITVGGQISGHGFRDYDADGVNDANERGVADITVAAYDVTGAAVVSDTTDSSGDYTLTGLTDTDEYRIEFTDLPSYLQSGPCGTDSETTVAFATSPATGVDVGLANPAEYCQDDPDLVTPLYRNGDPLIGSGPDTDDVLVSFAYSASGTSPAPTSAAIGSEVGSTWGLAYERTQQKLFSAAFLKRHVGLGSQGLGGIYVTDFSGGSPSTSDFIDLSTLGVSVGTVASNSARGLSGLTDPSTDETVFDDIGEIGLGDMDISDDGSTLWVVSLNDKKLVKIDISDYIANGTTPTTSEVSTFTIPERPSGCIDDEYRPFGLKFYQDRVYVGAVCSDETPVDHQDSSNLHAYVMEFNPSTGAFAASPVLDFPLDSTSYPKGAANTDNSPDCEQWYPWSDDFSQFFVQAGDPEFFCRTQPILSDIEFDDSGAMILGFIDRAGHQLGHLNYEPYAGNTHLIYVSSGGDILRAEWDGASWVLESNAQWATIPGSPTGCGVGTGEGPGGGEFYCQDLAYDYHKEVSVGGLAQLASVQEVVVTAFDPWVTGGEDDLFTGGVLHLSNEDGTRSSGYRIYQTVWGGQEGYFGKAAGLGDLELLCDPAPIEIGNRVWEETDGNGIQDPEETNIAGVDVELWADTNDDGIADTQVGTATTDANGNYYFGGVNDSNMTGGNSVEPNTAYELRISLTDPDLPYGATPTPPDQGTDLHDSDGDNGGIHTGYSTVQFTTGAAGANNHTYDFGFDPLPTAVTLASFTARASRGTLGLWSWVLLAGLAVLAKGQAKRVVQKVLPQAQARHGEQKSRGSVRKIT
jgi:hypothetical protein